MPEKEKEEEIKKARFENINRIVKKKKKTRKFFSFIFLFSFSLSLSLSRYIKPVSVSKNLWQGRLLISRSCDDDDDDDDSFRDIMKSPLICLRKEKKLHCAIDRFFYHLVAYVPCFSDVTKYKWSLERWRWWCDERSWMRSRGCSCSFEHYHLFIFIF